MRVLIDTHVLIWLLEGRPELPAASLAVLEREIGLHGAAVSAMSFWEVAMLAKRGRIALLRPVAAWRQAALGLPRVVEVPLAGEVAVEAAQLPGEFHADPADRFLVATARVLGMRLATRDGRILDYARSGLVQVLPV
ncbi:MAG: type II toxin-antitoxin system VapC family toxin [Deltaproteobacteria bacterium]|nr:type II toxin-antitoxin system VapC family toxin [Deltaproteobacteria bacterium]